MRNIAIRVGLFLLVGAGALVARPFLTGNVGELKVGECFDTPDLSQTIEDIQHHPCSDSHGGEVILVGKHAAAKGVPYPKDAVLTSEIEARCTPAFTAYTGLNASTDPNWSFGYFYPIAKGWADGDRGFICYATRVDGKTTTGSIKKS